VTIDCTDCPIEEPTDFDEIWYSQKLNGPGVKYEVGINIRVGNIVWVYGGFPCGEKNDLELSKERFLSRMPLNEKVVADDGYKTSLRYICPANRPAAAGTIRRILARHENVNGMLKSFRVLASPFRHELHKHRWCFYAIANITQLMIQYESSRYPLMI